VTRRDRGRARPRGRTLYARIAAALLVLLLALGAGYVVLTLFSTRMYLAEVSQRLNRDLASHLASELTLIEDGDVNEEALDHAFHMMMVINPRIEIYLLDETGRILAFSAKPDKIRRETVSVEPIRRFLTGDPRLPVWGDDPRHPSRQNVFSAAPVRDASGLEGYLYVVLAGEQHASVMNRIQQSHILRLSLGVLGGSLLVGLAAGLLLFGRITRRVSGLESRVAAFDASGFRELPEAWTSPGRSGGDEVGRLEDAVRRMGERILQQLEDLRRTDETRRELVASVSHDLRTPLASLRGYLETLQLRDERMSEGERRECVRVALRQAERLSQLVDELFELAKLEASGSAPRCEAFAMDDLVQDLLTKFRDRAAEREVALRMEREEGLPRAWGELGLISRVLENLVDNAIRYTEPGGAVTVRLESAGRGVRVQVEDTGVGIPSSDVGRIFERFYRGEHRDEREEGSGLGLAIVKRILDMHGAEIEVRSQPGRGSAFWFDLGTPQQA
jgi:signal transduction histidine kinase